MQFIFGLFRIPKKVRFLITAEQEPPSNTSLNFNSKLASDFCNLRLHFILIKSKIIFKKFKDNLVYLIFTFPIAMTGIMELKAKYID